MIAYRAVPYLLVAAPPVIVLLAIFVCGSSMTRTADEEIACAQPSPYIARRDSEKLVRELDRRPAREDLQRVMNEAQR